MIDCTEQVYFNQIVQSRISYQNKQYKPTEVTYDKIYCDIEFVYQSPNYEYQFGSVKTDDTAVNQEHKLGNEQTLYNIVDLHTGWVVAKVFEGKRKQAAKFLSEQYITHQGNGLYTAKNWTAEIQSRLQYVQEND